MQILTIHAPMKEVEYCGTTFHVPADYNWIATDADGKVFGYQDEPNAMRNGGYWSGKEYDYLGKALLRNTDWQTTLKYVGA